jgi:serine/alanine adding enzyme
VAVDCAGIPIKRPFQYKKTDMLKSVLTAEETVTRISACGRGDEPDWDSYVLQNPSAHGYHLSAWRRIIESSFGHPTYYLRSENGEGRINGVLPLVRLRSRMFGDFMVSMPYVNYGGPCADTHEIAMRLVAEASLLAAGAGVRHLEVRTVDNTDFGLRMRSAKASMRLTLPGQPDDLWKAFSSKLRSQIKRAQQEDTVVQIGRATELDAFYEVFAANMRDLGTPVYSRDFFHTILRELPESFICSVYYRGEPAAVGFLLGFRGTLEIPWASSLRRLNRFSPNMLLYWSVLKEACERGYRTFDFGRSTPESGPYKFKAQWGAAPVPLNWHYWLPQGSDLPDLTPNNPRYQLAVRLWQRLPIAVTKIIGPSIVKNLP